MKKWGASGEVVSLYRVDKVIGDEVSTLYGYTTSGDIGRHIVRPTPYSPLPGKYPVIAAEKSSTYERGETSSPTPLLEKQRGNGEVRVCLCLRT
jgi:hypothetical protein